MLSDVLGLMEKQHKGKEDIQSHVIPQLAKKFGNRLGLQLRSMKAIYSEATTQCLAAMDLPNINEHQLERLSLAYAASRAALKSLRATAKSILKESTK